MYSLPVGELLSALCALVWAIAVIFFKKTGEFVSPLSLNIYKNIVAIILWIPTLFIFKTPILPRVPGWYYLITCISGFLGITIADTLFFMCLNRIGANLTALVDCLYTPMVLLLLGFVFSEPIGISILISGVLIISGILIGTLKREDFGVSKKDFFYGLLLGSLSMFFVAVGIVMMKEPLGNYKSAFESVPLLWLTGFRILSATIFLVAGAVIHKDRKKHFSCFIPSRAWKTMLPGSILGTYISMVIWLAGWKYSANPAVATVLNQLTLIFVMILSAIYLGEKITVRRILAVFLAGAGGVIAGLYG